jgi:TonB family protein
LRSKTPGKEPCTFFCNETALEFKKVNFHIVEDKKYHVKALLVSLIAHVSFFLIFLSMGDRVIQTNKPIVIDFSMEESITSGKGSLESKISVMENKIRGAGYKRDVKRNEPEIKRQQMANEESNEKSVLQSNTSIEQAVVAETEAPVLGPVEENSESTTIFTTSASAGASSGSIGGLSRGGSNIGGTRTGMIGSSGDGSGGGGHSGKIRYLKENFSYIRDMIQKKVIYPKIARQMGWQGKVTVSFIIFADGFAKDVKIMQTSGIEVLDSSATVAVKDASPFPKPPCEAQIIIPLVYKLN